MGRRKNGSVRYQIQNVPTGLALMPESLLTIEQVAKYLKVDKFTVYRLVTQKKLPGFKVGNQWRFKRETIDSWLEQNSNMRAKKSNQ